MLNYNIEVLNDKSLTCESVSSVVLGNEHERGVSQLTFHLDEELPDGKHYLVFSHREKSKSILVPLLSTNSYVINSYITSIPGIWYVSFLISDVILDTDNIVDANEERYLNSSSILYISNPLKGSVKKSDVSSDIGTISDEDMPLFEIFSDELLTQVNLMSDQLLNQVSIISDDLINNINNINNKMEIMDNELNKIEGELNKIIDDVSGQVYRLGIENGQFYFEPINAEIASFTFSNAAIGLSGAGAKALPVGNIEFITDPEKKKVLSLKANSYLRVIRVSGAPLLEGIEEMTISYDSKPSSSTNNIGWTFFAARNADTQELEKEHYIGIMDNVDGITIERYNGGPRAAVVTGVSSAQWKHVDVVLTKTETTLYINGVKQDSKPSNFLLTDIFNIPGCSILQIGKANWVNGEYYNGLLDNFKIYNYAKNEKEIGGLK